VLGQRAWGKAGAGRVQGQPGKPAWRRCYTAHSTATQSNSTGALERLPARWPPCPSLRYQLARGATCLGAV